jgi:ketosteroid isomerase-like protein
VGCVVVLLSRTREFNKKPARSDLPPPAGGVRRRIPMTDFQALADGVEIEALRGEFTDAVMMMDYDCAASLFTEDGVVRMPALSVEITGREAVRVEERRVRALADFLVQNTHPGTIMLDGDTASGRAYVFELGRARDGWSMQAYAIYHDRYRRTGDGWKFTERVYEVRYQDRAPLLGSPPPEAGPHADFAGEGAAGVGER